MLNNHDNIYGQKGHVLGIWQMADLVHTVVDLSETLNINDRLTRGVTDIQYRPL